MDFGAREILVIVAVLVLIGIVLDGMRRVKRSRYENLQMSSRKLHQNASEYSEDGDDFEQSQFPSGGSRVIASRDIADVDMASSKIVTDSTPAGRPQQQGFDLDLPISASRADELSDLEALSNPSTSNTKTEDSVPQDVLVIHLVAKKGSMISGKDLLDASTDLSLRYGGMKIFHRHASTDGSGPVLFSMANLVNPGTFDLNTIHSITTPGVTLFMALDDIEDPLTAFDLMVDTTRSLAEKLELNMMDESRSSMTAQTIDHYRQRAKKAVISRTDGQF